MQRLERLIQMIEIINKGRCPSTDYFCQKFECAPRTVHGDISFLKENLGYPITFDNFKGGYVNSDPSKKLPEFELNESEIFVLTLGREMISEYMGTGFESLLSSALEKINQRLPERVRANLPELMNAVSFKASGVKVSRKLFFEVSDACDNDRALSLMYFSASKGQSTFREIEPYRLVESRGVWYCIAWCCLRNAVRMFALHRIGEYQVLSRTFTRRTDVDIDAYIDNAFLLEHGDPPQRFAIKFDAGAARYVRERQWHSTQELVDHPDDSCTLSFTATSIDEVKRWVLPYGASAEVLEPAELRTAVQQEVDKLQIIYSQRQPARMDKRQNVAARNAASKDGTAMDNSCE